MGLSRREFAKAEGCSEGAVRYALRQRRLVARPDGTLDPSQLGGGWLRNYRPNAKSRAKSAEVAQPRAQIPDDVAHYYGWDEPDHNDEVTEGFGLMLDLKETIRKDPESVAHCMAGHTASLLKREAYKLGWREKGVSDDSPSDTDPIGPKEWHSAYTDQPLNFGLVRSLGRAMKVGANPKDAVEFDINDPVLVAEAMMILASDIVEEELKRRRFEQGIISPRDKR